jgi:hypothetical protein
MTIYLCRDYPTQFTTEYQGDIAQWVLALFLKDVLGYTVVGSTNFTANFTPLASGTASPNLAGINYGSTGGSGGGTAYFEVGVPSGVYTVSAADVQRVLVLKSPANPTFNSGVFLIQGVDTVNNRFIIDYRTADPGSNTFPPPEAGGTTGIQWWLYGNDSSVPATRSSNGGTGYHGYGTSTNSRIILQSPHATAWQVRLCSEATNDQYSSGGCNPNTVAPGFGGNASGDFPTGASAGKHLHTALFWDTLNTNQGADPTRVFVPGYTAFGSSNLTVRITIIGDDGGQAVAIFVRKLQPSGTLNPGFAIFGLPDNEPTPLPTDNTMRLFALGWVDPQNSGQNISIGWFTGEVSVANMQGNGFSSLGVPVSAAPGLWAYIEGNGQGASPIASGNASDNPFLSGTELTDVDIWVGTQQTWNAGTYNYAYPLEPRLIGTVPMLRAGRQNFTTFSSTTDAGRAWYHHQNGVYMTYNGPNPVP